MGETTISTVDRRISSMIKARAGNQNQISGSIRPFWHAPSPSAGRRFPPQLSLEFTKCHQLKPSCHRNLQTFTPILQHRFSGSIPGTGGFSGLGWTGTAAGVASLRFGTFAAFAPGKIWAQWAWDIDMVGRQHGYGGLSWEVLCLHVDKCRPNAQKIKQRAPWKNNESHGVVPVVRRTAALHWANLVNGPCRKLWRCCPSKTLWFNHSSHDDMHSELASKQVY